MALAGHIQSASAGEAGRRHEVVTSYFVVDMQVVLRSCRQEDSLVLVALALVREELAGHSTAGRELLESDLQHAGRVDAGHWQSRGDCLLCDSQDCRWSDCAV